jgi:hypothetical protein
MAGVQHSAEHRQDREPALTHSARRRARICNSVRLAKLLSKRRSAFLDAANARRRKCYRSLGDQDFSPAESLLASSARRSPSQWRHDSGHLRPISRRITTLNSTFKVIEWLAAGFPLGGNRVCQFVVLGALLHGAVGELLAVGVFGVALYLCQRLVATGVLRSQPGAACRPSLGHACGSASAGWQRSPTADELADAIDRVRPVPFANDEREVNLRHCVDRGRELGGQRDVYFATAFDPVIQTRDGPDL